MFGPRFFGGRFFAARFFGDGGDQAPPPIATPLERIWTIAAEIRSWLIRRD
jgi:hypothetical protein